MMRRILFNKVGELMSDNQKTASHACLSEKRVDHTLDHPQKTQIYKKRYIVLTALGRRYSTFIKVIPNEDDINSIDRGRLRSCQIQTSEGLNISRAFNFQLNRVRERWNVAIKRSTGFVLFDTIWRGAIGFFAAITAVLRLFLGTRVRMSDLLEGAEFKSRTIEEQRETETMVFASIAAIMRAARFSAEGSAEITYEDDAYMAEVNGLTFTGGMAGTMGAEEEEDDEDGEGEFDEDDLEAMMEML